MKATKAIVVVHNTVAFWSAPGSASEGSHGGPTLAMAVTFVTVDKVQLNQVRRPSLKRDLLTLHGN